MTDKPTESELRNRLEQQLQWRNDSDVVVLLWRGYLAGLFEWSVIDLATYERLTKLLRRVGSKELDELFSGEPISTERAAEIDQFTRENG